MDYRLASCTKSKRERNIKVKVAKPVIVAKVRRREARRRKEKGRRQNTKWKLKLIRRILK